MNVPTLPGRIDSTIGEASIFELGALRVEIGWQRRSPWRTDGPGAAGYMRLATTARHKPQGERPMKPARLRELARTLAAYADKLDSWQLAEAIEDEHRAELAPVPMGKEEHAFRPGAVAYGQTAGECFYCYRPEAEHEPAETVPSEADTARLRRELARHEAWLAGDWDSRSARGIAAMERHRARRDELRALLA